ncbi:MAG: tRNA (adenosine(37)-N6)-threonylcarbamoyltransferase complex ATPase subunit type 1 TsaE [bacterium]
MAIALSIVTEDCEETQKLGEELGRSLPPGSVVALTGELGSGKTTLIQGIGKGLGIESLIKSPSFVIIHEYAGPVPLYHFDLYRITHQKEIISLGYQDYFYQKKGIVVIEWAEKIENVLPTEYLKIELEIMDLSKRRIALQAYGSFYRKVVEKMKKGGYFASSGYRYLDKKGDFVPGNQRKNPG